MELENEAIETGKLKNEPKVKEALERTNSQNARREKSEKSFYGLYLLLLLVFLLSAITFFLINIKYWDIRDRYIPLVQKLSVSIMIAIAIIFVNHLLKVILSKYVTNVTFRYNLKRIFDLVAVLLIAFNGLSVIFVNWYATVVSLGLISLVLGLALQNPITSFFAWVFILVRKPYEVGDRIKIGDMYGDVIELGYFDTTLWEFRGDYLSGDHPSGRRIKFANSKVFTEFICNYSWGLFPYIWNEISFFVSYESDLEFVTAKAKAIAEQEIGPQMNRRVKLYRNVIKETPISDLDVREKPSVLIRANNNTWIEVVLRYLVDPKETGEVRNRIFNKVLQELRNSNDKVMFPKTNMR